MADPGRARATDAKEPPASSRLPAALLGALQAFDAAFRLGSFKAAAQSLHLTTSAVSHRIRKLETTLGVDLFVRSNRRVSPTAAGESLAIMTGRAFSELARALHRNAGPERRRSLRVSVFPLFGSAWLLPRMAAFIEGHPDIELSISMSTHPVDFDAEPVDAVIRSGSGDWPGLTAIRLMPLYTTPVASPTVAARLLEVGDLPKAPLIQMSRFPQAWPNWFESQGLGFQPPAQTIWVEGFEAAMLAAEQGAGVALGLWPLCAPSIAADRLTELFDRRVATSPCWLAYRSVDTNHPPLVAFRRWLQAALKTLEAAASRSRPARTRP